MKKKGLLLYSTFDVFPSAKGATTHIAHTLDALRDTFTTIHLVCLGWGDMPAYQEEGNIIIHRCKANHPNFLKRTRYFESFLSTVLDQLSGQIDVVHFRDAWSGLPILEHPAVRERNVLKIFEVNGLPSVELPYHYPLLLKNPAFMGRIKSMENYCLDAADGILTVSRVNRRYLLHRGVSPGKIAVLPNTARPAEEQPGDTGDDETAHFNAGDGAPFILYTGTLSPWQGLPVLLRAFHLLRHREKLRLLLISSHRKYLRPLRKMVKKMKLTQQVTITKELSREEVYRFYRKAYLSVAPLTRCSRNELQGCSPLKIIESMAVGTPVVASRLPVCAEIIDHNSDGWLVSPGSPRALAHGMQQLLDQHKLRDRLGQQAQKKIAGSFRYETWNSRLHHAYHTFLKAPVEGKKPGLGIF